MKKWFPTIITIALGGLAAVTPQTKDALQHHPNAVVGLAVAYAILKGLLPSPITKEQK